MRFSLPPVDDPTIFDTAEHRQAYTMDVAAPAAEVWAGLVAERPLAWCRNLRGHYTSPRPFGAGTTREVTVGGVLKLHERFFHWEESDDGYRHCFAVEQMNVPGLTVFAEDYRVTPRGSGSRFVWRFAFEGRPALGVRLLQPLQRRFLLDGFERDTLAHFGPQS